MLIDRMNCYLVRSIILSSGSRHLSLPQPDRTFFWLMLIGSNVLFSSSAVAAKYALSDISVTMMLALRWSSASGMALHIACGSIFTAILSWLMLYELFHKRAVFTLVLGLMRVYLVVERAVIPTIPAVGGIRRILGDLLIILGLLVDAV